MYILYNIAVGLGKNPKLINVVPTFIPEARVGTIKSQVSMRVANK